MLHHARRVTRSLFVLATCGLMATHATAGDQAVTTVLSHGYSTNQTKGVWVEALADAIIARGGAGGAVCRYDQATGAWQLVSGTLDPNAPVALIYRWLNDFSKDGPDFGFAEGAADAMVPALRDPIFVDGGGQPIAGIELVEGRLLHFLGHSRGAIINSEVVQRFGAEGLTVDHVTTMDAHPVNGTLDAPYDFDWGDPTPHTWTNITFADNYWRADGGGIINGLDFDGIPIPGSLPTMLSESALNCCAYTFAHSDVHLWYHGTVDTSPAPCDGDECINAEMRNTWWPEGFTERGFYYARLGGGSDQRPALDPGMPLEPVPSLYGGSFDEAAFAGWLYHGGSVDGVITSEGGDGFLRLGAGAGGQATHNRFLLRAQDGQLVLDARVTTPAAGESLKASLVARDGTTTSLGSISLETAGGWMAGLEFTIPTLVPRDASYRLVLEIAPAGAPAGVVDVDNLRFEPGAPTCIADLSGDGAVGPADLALLLDNWGPGRGNPADLNLDGDVGPADLALLLDGWGVCP